MDSPRSGAELKDVAEAEGARRATGVSANGGTGIPEEPSKAKWRQFSVEYRLRILKEANA